MLRTLLPALVALASWSGAAAACSAPPPPFHPGTIKWDMILLGEVTNDVGTEGVVHADLAVRRVIAGRHSGRSYRLEWQVYDGSGMCPAPGPDLKKRQNVVVYIKGREGQLVRGWMLVRDAIKADPRVRAALGM